jgi:xylulokinase
MKEAEPENHKKIKKIMFMKDYVRYRLTGDFVTDTIDAMGSELMDVPDDRWSEELCAMTGLPASAFPRILKPTDVIGGITEKAAHETGLSIKTKVAVGSTDTVMEVYANGAIKPGQMTVKLATAGRICVMTEKNLPNPVLVNYKHVVPGLWYPGTGSKTCAASYRWYRDVLCADEVRRGGEAGRP